MKKKHFTLRPELGKKFWHVSIFLFSLFFSSVAVAQAPIHVAGAVKDSKGNALAGVSVKIKNSTLGTTTDDKGEYKINAPSRESVLVFSSVGFIEHSEVVGENALLN